MSASASQPGPVPSGAPAPAPAPGLARGRAREFESLRAELRVQLRVHLEETRARTLLLVSRVSPDDALVQHDPLMSPLVWDLGHIAAFERLWLLEQLERVVEFGEMPGLFNPFEHPRATRGTLALPSLDDALTELARVRASVLARLEDAPLADGPPLLRDGYVYRMVLQHEAQHQETMLQTLQLKLGAPYSAPRVAPPRGRAPDDEGAMVRVAGGEVAIGTDDRTAAYDNERPRHSIRIAPFEMDVTPVTNGAYLAFVEAGGYERREWWCDAGWAWRVKSGATAPRHWTRDRAGGRSLEDGRRREDGRPRADEMPSRRGSAHSENGPWMVRTMDRWEPMDPLEPVCHVCHHEAEAFARYAGKRLPTEAEWEVAATWNAAEGRQQRYPWGDEPPGPDDANVGQLAFGVAQVWAYPRNVSPAGCYGMIGDVWEWTASEFGGYPGFSAFPYREYSEPFFGSEYRVLRGGSWATSPLVARSTFRNWDYPIRRQIFSGFRCARDA